MDQNFSRRKFIQRTVFFSGASLGLGLLLSRCGSNTGTDGKKENKPQQDNKANTGTATDTNNAKSVTEADLQKRKQLGYVDKTPIEDSYCSNCALYILPAEGKEKGGCQLFKGEVNPNGYCTYWAAPQQ